MDGGCPVGWVQDNLGLELVGRADHVGPPVRNLAGLALRTSAGRAHLLVSPALAKHVPGDPARVLSVAHELGRAVRVALAGKQPDLVVGYAETATGLGHTVAAELGTAYLHSTRRPPAQGQLAVHFEEEHSHATSHRLLPPDAGFIDGRGPLVLVDDELSTGRTALNTIRALHLAGVGVRRHCVVAALLDLRSDDDIVSAERWAKDMGIRLDFVALARGCVGLPPNVNERARVLLAEMHQIEASRPSGGAGPLTRSSHRYARTRWPVHVPHHGRDGFRVEGHNMFETALRDYVQALNDELDPGPWHVLGTEELMYLPTRLAAALAEYRADITSSSTTRSPIAVLNHPDYPIRSAITFAAHDCSDDTHRFAYNLAGKSRILLIVDDETHPDKLLAPDGLTSQLERAGAEVVVAVVPARVLPAAPLRGPAFGSYPALDVGWLLTDLSHVTLEASVEDREESIQSGLGHYAESLPIEYTPTEEYANLYEKALELSRMRVARCVGVVAELILLERGSEIVLASLARAGTPVGVLLRHWYADRCGLDVPHYAVSIVRGRGIDEVALRWLAAHHDPSAVVFVDGWTGKGMIARELAEAIRFANSLFGTRFVSDLAVLADTGNCVELFGTREDFLIPSACLNSTVSGLVSRTVLRPDLIGPHAFHGAKFYRSLVSADVSGSFVAAVRAAFPGVSEGVALEVEALRQTDRRPSWSGRAIVAEVGARFGVSDENLIKPGVGETTRVLLRRVPWKVLLRQGSAAEVPHVLRLAEERGVEVVEVPDLGYTTIGLIRPRVPT